MLKSFLENSLNYISLLQKKYLEGIRSCSLKKDVINIP